MVVRYFCGNFLVLLCVSGLQPCLSPWSWLSHELTYLYTSLLPKHKHKTGDTSLPAFQTPRSGCVGNLAVENRKEETNNRASVLLFNLVLFAIHTRNCLKYLKTWKAFLKRNGEWFQQKGFWQSKQTNKETSLGSREDFNYFDAF